MIPLRLIFRNRWAALAWSAGFIWTAIDFAGDQSGGNGSANAIGINDSQVAAIIGE